VAVRNAVPIAWKPRGLTDARDGTNAFDGAMRRLVNVIVDPSTGQLWVPRPAGTQESNFTGSNAPASAGTLSSLLVIGDIAYGLVPSSLNVGFDQPFAYDLDNDAFLPVVGVTSANVPSSPPTSGDWTPPIMAQVGSRVVVTHPGFSGANLFSLTTIGNTTLDSVEITGNPDILGVLPGMGITGTGIPAGTTILAVEYFYMATTGDTHTNTTLDNLGSTSGVAVGTRVGGAVAGGIPASTTTVAALVSSTEVTMSAAATATSAGIVIEFLGAKITMSAGATATANGVTLTITGVPELIGFFDVSGFSQATQGIATYGGRVIEGNPSILGVQPGMTITGHQVGSGEQVIPTGTTVVQTALVTRQVYGVLTLGSTAITLIDISGIDTEQTVDGLGISPGTEVTFVSLGVNGTQVSISKPATATGISLLTFTGATITLSAATTTPAFPSLRDVKLVISGGTRIAPLWGAVNTDRNLLPSLPVGVAQFNGRAFYACGIDGIPYSDSGFACRISNSLGVQALTLDDGLEATALGQLLLTAPLTGGIVQAIIVFEGANKMRQITGDQAFGNLAMNLLPVATGTEAPLSIVPTELGLAFVSPLGLRFVKFDGTVTPPVGADGQGITDPFQFAAAPSSICAAANSGVLRITVRNGQLVDSLPYEEYWFDTARKMWHGPHTFPSRLIQPWRTSFLLAPIGVPASLFRSDAFASNTSSYTENGNVLSWLMETVLLPDNARMAMNAVIDTNLMCSASTDDDIRVTALDEEEMFLDTITIGTIGEGLRQRNLDWTVPLIFKQMAIRISRSSDDTVRIGNLYLRYRILGYDDDLVGDDNFLLDDAAPYVILSDDSTPEILLTPG